MPEAKLFAVVPLNLTMKQVKAFAAGRGKPEFWGPVGPEPWKRPLPSLPEALEEARRMIAALRLPRR